MKQLRKDAWGWNEEATTAFEHLKKATTEAPVLALPYFTKQFIIETDASNGGLGAILMQESHPTTYFSKTMGNRASLKLIYEKKLMAIVFVVLKRRHYLLGRKFVVKTDQSSLRFLLCQREVGVECQKWLMKIMGFDFEIVYNSGSSNRVADALYCKSDDEVFLGALCSSHGIDWKAIDDLVRNDAILGLIIQKIEARGELLNGFTVEHSQLWYKGRYALPKTSPFISTLLYEYHGLSLGGHMGEHKTYSRIAVEWFWEGIRKQIVDYVKSCGVCKT